MSSPNGLKRQVAWRTSVGNWLGESWLAAAGNEPVRQLRRRHDWLANSELAILGAGLEVARHAGAHGTVARWSKDIRGSDAGNAAGALWEVVCCKLFDVPGVIVRPGAASEPGFDLSVESIADSPSLRVSCKALTRSARASTFHNFTKLLHRALVEALHAGPPVQIVLHEADDGVTAAGWDVKRMAHSIARLCTSGTLDVDVTRRGWTISLGPLPARHYPYAPGAASFSLIVTAKHHNNEQRRFNDKLEEAIRKFAKHCGPSDNRWANIVAVQVPISVNFVDALRWVQEAFDRSGPLLSAVVLQRSFVGTAPDSRPGLFHDYCWLSHGNQPLNRCIELSLPIGLARTQNIAPVLTDGRQAQTFRDRYVHFSGNHTLLHNCTTPFDSADLGFAFGIDTTYFINGHAVLAPGPHVRLGAPLLDSTLIL